MTRRRVALVTGGTRGIGLGIAEALARGEFDLAVCGVRSQDAARSALDRLRAFGGTVEYVRADVASSAQRRRLLAAVRRRFRRLHVLVNNAGIAPRMRRDVLEATERSFDEVLGVNLKGPYFLTQSAARWMIAQRKKNARWRGCIINVTSMSATVVSISRGEYCVSKAGLAMATQLWAVRLGPHDIPVFEIRPGVVRTDMTAAVRDRYERLIADGLCVQARWGTPDDVGKTAAMLARGDLAYSTGQVILVDGGLTIQRL